MPPGLMALVTVVMHMVSAQERGSNVLRQGTSQNIQSVIVTDRTRAFLSCESGDMVVRVNFTLPFRGLMYAYRSRSSPCRILGSGGMYYVLRIPLKGCGTWQETPRVFVNNITIRFHPALELEEDETKTVVCRYPPPLTPSPGSINIIEPVIPPTSDPTRIARARLSEVEILIIICLLLFLSLLTLGIGIAYFCLKKRNIHLVRRKPMSSAPASQLTKLSGSTPQQPSLLSGTILGHTVRIPRAVPYSASIRTHTLSDHPYDYEENITSSPGISRDSLDSSPSTSTTSSESTDTAQQLLLRGMASASTALTIPKAVLRKSDLKRQTLPSLHQRFTPAASALKRKIGEREDQTVTTVLEPEYNDYGNKSNLRTPQEGSRNSPMPVYAQVDKRKPRVRIVEDAQIIGAKAERQKSSALNVSKSVTHAKKGSSDFGNSAVATKSRDTILKSTSKNVQDFTETSRPSKGITSEQAVWKNPSVHKSHKTLPVHENKTNIATKKNEVIESASDSKNVCIQDISDIYVTTTVETESTEIRTTISRDIIEEHVKDKNVFKDEQQTTSNGEKKSTQSSILKRPMNTDHSSNQKNSTYQATKSSLKDTNPHDELRTLSPSSSISETLSSLQNPKESQEKNKGTRQTDNWNVIIRQLKPPILTAADSAKEVTDGQKQIIPRFDVKIRTIPPTSSAVLERGTPMDRRDSTELVDVPQLKMPHSIEKIRGIIAQLEPKKKTISGDEIDNNGPDGGKAAGIMQRQKAVWWPENQDPMVAIYSPEPTDIVSGTESYKSEASLRERSSSEVLEKIPTLSTQPGHPGRAGLVRSSSEIMTARGDHSKWIKDVPVFESYSPDFLSNIPVVTQGGFFHEQFSAEAKEKLDKKDHKLTKS